MSVDSEKEEGKKNGSVLLFLSFRVESKNGQCSSLWFTSFLIYRFRDVNILRKHRCSRVINLFCSRKQGAAEDRRKPKSRESKKNGFASPQREKKNLHSLTPQRSPLSLLQLPPRGSFPSGTDPGTSRPTSRPERLPPRRPAPPRRRPGGERRSHHRLRRWRRLRPTPASGSRAHRSPGSALPPTPQRGGHHLPSLRRRPDPGRAKERTPTQRRWRFRRPRRRRRHGMRRRGETRRQR